MSYNIVEEVEYNPNAVVHVNKQIWDDEQKAFVLRRFLRYRRSTKQQIERDSETLSKAYGPPKYQGMWWMEKDRNFVWLAESAATFWMLKTTNEI